jgi:ABC-type glycerol-3-phosphate transport system substrate-binding protein
MIGRGKGMSRRRLLRAGVASATALTAVTALPRKAPAVSRKVSLRYWTFLDPKDPGPRSNAQTQMIDAFQKKHPEIEVKCEVMAWQQIDPQIMQAVGAGKGPDVTRIAANSVAANTEAGTIIPLNPWTDKWANTQKADFYPDWDALLIDGQRMSLPIGAAATIFCYRKDLIEKVGLTVPTSWDDLITVSKALTKDPVWGTVVGVSEKNQASDLWQTFLPQVWSYGGDVFKGKQVVLEQPAWVETFQYWRDMVRIHKAAPPGMVNETTDTIMEGFMAGTFATMFNQNQKLAQVRTSKVIPPDSMGVAMMPGKGGKPGPTPLAGWQIAICKDVKEKEAAWLFIDHMLSPEMQLVNAKVAEEVPSRKSVGMDPWFKSPEAYYVNAYFKICSESGKVFQYPAKFNNLSDYLAVAIQQVIVKDAPIEKVLKEAEDRYNSEVED